MQDEQTSERAPSRLWTPARVAASAIQQAARHERALLACLAELDGVGAPPRELADATFRRAARHAGRAISLARTAIRLNRDPRVDAIFAAVLERHERNALVVERRTPAAGLAIAG
jgi:hypothetical protein